MFMAFVLSGLIDGVTLGEQSECMLVSMSVLAFPSDTLSKVDSVL